MRMFVLVPLVMVFFLVSACSDSPEVETITRFDPAVPETPESIQIDRHGHIYISLNLIGEVRKIAPDGTQSTLARLPLHPEIQPCQNVERRQASSAGIALGHQGNVYVSVNSCNLAKVGIWKVTPDGQQSLLAALPGDLFPPGRVGLNGIAYHDGWLYVADSRLAMVWRVHADGQSPTEVWTDDPLLQHPSTPLPGIPGPNGVQVFQNEVYVSVSDRGHVVAFRINADGSAGTGRVHVVLGVDDFAFDVQGNLYAMTNFSQMVVRVTPGGATETLLAFLDGLDGPSSAAFGVGKNHKNLYIANAAFSFAPEPIPNPRRPSVMRLHIDIPGQPRP
jgi:sugar lactone lactonase YvrE